MAISNERIVGIDANGVALRGRADAASGKKRTIRLPGGEFIDRFLRHVLPQGFKRIRHYGLLSPARAALAVPAPPPAAVEAAADFLRRVAGSEWLACPHCRQGRFAAVEPIPPRPSLHPRAQAPP